MTDPERRCPGCGVDKGTVAICCNTCWRRVPLKLQWSGNGSREHIAAALKWLAAHRVPDPG